MEFCGTIPRMSSTMAERAKLLVPELCDGWDCGGSRVRYVRRLIRASVTVHLQCQMCGKSFGALKRAEVYNWQDLREWDESLRTEWNAERTAERAAEHEKRQAAFPVFQMADLTERRADYRRWLLTSPEWRTLRDRVMRRSLFICEACLANKANDVHHVTYELGRLPPAWELRAVCRSCHDRLHDWSGGDE